MTDDKSLSLSNGRFAFVDINNAKNVVIDGLEFNVGRYHGINIVSDDVTVKNCVIFRGVNIARGAVVENSIIMQDSVISENVKLNCVIMDKDSVVKTLDKSQFSDIVKCM